MKDLMCLFIFRGKTVLENGIPVSKKKKVQSDTEKHPVVSLGYCMADHLRPAAVF